MWDTMTIKIKYKLPKNYVVLVYVEKVPRHFWRISIVTEVLPSRSSDKKKLLWELRRPSLFKNCKIRTSKDNKETKFMW